MLRQDDRVAILLHEGIHSVQGKTGLAMLRYSEANIVAVIDRQFAEMSLADLTGIHRNVPIVATLDAALVYKPTVLAIGIAPSGGALPAHWRDEIRQAIVAGLSIVNGLHTPLNQDAELRSRLQPGQWLWDVRQEPANLAIGTGSARLLTCLRVLTVGTDMSVGKMSTSLELHRVALARGLRSQFLASGQTGIMIAGRGMPLDAIRVDFAAGAVEQLVMQASDADILHIEGQGSLLNPASTATLPLLRGSQPTHLILVHRAGQTHLHKFPDVPIPPLAEVVQMYELIATAAGAFAPVKVVAIALNTAHLAPASARQAIAQVETETQLPCTDAVRFDANLLLNAILK